MRGPFKLPIHSFCFSNGYPVCLEQEGNGPILELRRAADICVHLSDSRQMGLKYGTSARVAWDPQVRHVSV